MEDVEEQLVGSAVEVVDMKRRQRDSKGGTNAHLCHRSHQRQCLTNYFTQLGCGSTLNH